jgi:acetyl-CoA carboxylase biotin carboxyl carrier protein
VTLSAAEISEIVKLIEESSFDELSLEMNGIKLHLRRAGRGQMEPVSPSAPSAHAATPAVPPAPAATPAAPVAGGRTIAAPLLGTFYRAPKPGAAPFVEVGTPVEEDTVIGIIEVMKLMNTVRAGLRGVIAEILAADGQLVEYGSALMRIADGG